VNGRRGGVLAVLVGGAAFGFLPLFARIAYDHGADPFGLLAARFGVAVMIALALRLAFMRDRPWPSFRSAVPVVLLGALGYGPQSTFYFNGIQRIDVSLATVIFFVFPVFVVVADWLVFGAKPTRAMTLCLAATVGGAALTAGQVGSGSATGAVFMVAAALWYTGYILVSSRILRGTDALTSITLAMSGAAFAHLVILVVTGADLPADLSGWSAAAGAAAVSTVFAMGLFFVGVTVVGPGQAAVLSTVEPVVSIAVGVLFLDESLGAARLAGAVLVLTGVTVLARLAAARDVG